MTQNNRLVLAKRPERGPVTDKTFHLESVELESLKDGEVLVKVKYSAIVSCCSSIVFIKLLWPAIPGR